MGLKFMKKMLGKRIKKKEDVVEDKKNNILLFLVV